MTHSTASSEQNPSQEKPCSYPAVPQRQPTACEPLVSWEDVLCKPCCRHASLLQYYDSPCIWHTIVENRAEIEYYSLYLSLNTWQNDKILLFKPIQHLYWTTRLVSVRKDVERQRSWHMQQSNLVASRPSPNATDIVIYEQHSTRVQKVSH